MRVTQSELIKRYNDENREQFNPKLFERSDDKLIEALETAILSCQREQNFTIKVQNFTVIKEYSAIMGIMKYYEDKHGRNRRKRKVNQYDYVDLKDSDVILLVVTYLIGAKDQWKTLTSYILVPIVVEKYYYKIFGNMYSSIYQIVDGSVYNNSLKANRKYPAVIMKTLSQPVNIKRTKYKLNTMDGSILEVNNYEVLVFRKNFGIMKYFLAKYGIYDVLYFLGLKYINYTYTDVKDDSLYTFKLGSIFITVPKILFDNDKVTQSFIYTMVTEAAGSYDIDDIARREFWLKKLGKEFGSPVPEKGISILNSLEAIRDINTVNELGIPLEYKYDIYCILRWIIREFDTLKNRDGLDLKYKRIRLEEVIASLYTLKLNKSIYMLSDLGSKVTVDKIEKFIRTRPTYLIEAICKCNLSSYRNLVNDLDAITALKYTYKGEGGITTPQIQYRHVHPSHIGRVDPDSSTKSDPGMSGVLCPLVETYNGHFSNFKEPNEWEANYANLLAMYEQDHHPMKRIFHYNEKQLFGFKEVLERHNRDLELLKPVERKVVFKRTENTNRYWEEEDYIEQIRKQNNEYLKHQEVKKDEC